MSESQDEAVESKEQECPNCNQVTEFEVLGILPAISVFPEEELESQGDIVRVKAVGCTRCGEVGTESISDEEVDEGDKKVLQFMVRNDFMDEEEANELM